jgi:hypothetical protein
LVAKQILKFKLSVIWPTEEERKKNKPIGAGTY